MPAFNAQDTIERALNSLQAQTYTQWQLWVIDDGSSDATAQLVAARAEQDVRIHLICLPVNSGSPARARNAALTKAQGSYIAFLDADDAWLPNKLELQLAAMQRTGAALSCTAAEVVNGVGKHLSVRRPPAATGYACLLKQNTLVCSSVMVSAKRLQGRVFPDMGHEDYALWLQLTRAGSLVLGLPELLTIYTLRADSVSANKLKVLPYFWQIYRRQEGFSWFKSLCLTLRYGWLARRRAINHMRV